LEKCKYPIVLVHGMMVKNTRFRPAFRDISQALRQAGNVVHIANHDAVGSVAGNAAQLKTEILNLLETEHCEKVNIIAHSKGGVDARYMISLLDMVDCVASLTTLSSPHHGSGLSTKLLKMPLFCAKTIAFFANTFYRILGDRKPDMLQLGRDLTYDAMAEFNEATPNDPSVYYQSYSANTRDKKAFLMYLPYKISRFCEQGDSDGMVSVSSSQWGNYRGNIERPIDHFQMDGTFGNKQKRKDVSLFYLHIAHELQTMGF